MVTPKTESAREPLDRKSGPDPDLDIDLDQSPASKSGIAQRKQRMGNPRTWGSWAAVDARVLGSLKSVPSGVAL